MITSILKSIAVLVTVMSIVVFAAFASSCVTCSYSGEIISAEIQSLPKCKSPEEIRASLPHIPPIFGYYKWEKPDAVVLSAMFAQVPTMCKLNYPKHGFVVF